MSDLITILQPDDWHLHLRDHDLLSLTVPISSQYLGRVVAMPNLIPPIIDTDMAIAYRERILAHVPLKYKSFNPLMTLYLTEQTKKNTVIEASQNKHIIGFKLYPAGATTNSSQGIKKFESLYPILEIMQTHQVPLLIHGEVTDNNVDIFDREAAFIDHFLTKIVHKFPKLKIVLEHITTKQAIDFVKENKTIMGATITPQHLRYNRNDLLVGSIKPHLYCLPILKRNIHQEALITAATSGESCFFMGTDSAPHLQSKKENACGCAGCFNAPVAMAIYAEIFEQHQSIENLEAFTSINGANFYELPLNQKKITLIKEVWTVPANYYTVNKQAITPLCYQEKLSWKIKDELK